MPEPNPDQQLAFWFRQIDRRRVSWRERFRDWRATPGDKDWSTLTAALELARQVATAADFEALSREQQLAAITCLSHSEALADHELALECLQSLSGMDGEREELEAWLRERHDVIRLYGRFPARNRVLGRASTPAEAYFVVGFGQQFS